MQKNDTYDDKKVQKVVINSKLNQKISSYSVPQKKSDGVFSFKQNIFHDKRNINSKRTSIDPSIEIHSLKNTVDKLKCNKNNYSSN